jgi:HPr kinase/phosphorylase
MLIHGSCAAQEGYAVLILGPPGAGKSDLVLRLLGRGWTLVADDQVEVAPGPSLATAAPPAALAGMLEVRGLGILRDLPHLASAPLALVAQLAPRAEVPRLPSPARHPLAGGASLPLLALHAFDASAPQKLEWALAAAMGRARMHAGAFAA